MTGCRRAVLRRGGHGAALAAAALTLASCASHAGPGLVAAPAPTGVTGPAAGQLRITQVMVGHALYIEGAFSYIRIEPDAGGVPIERRLPDSGKLTITLDPGAYRMFSWQRACDGNCGNLDPPSDRCAQPFTLRQHEPVKATIRLRPGSGCTIVMRG